MNSTAEKLRKAAYYIGDGEVCSDTAIATVHEMFDVGRASTFSGDLGRVLVAIADELDKLQTKANEANNLRQRLESAEDKAERRKKHIGYLNTALHDKNAVLKRRGEAIARVTAENADLRKRVPSEREREILDMWPRFEDGDPVMPGDKVHYASTHNVETEIEVESITVMDGLFVLCDDECRSNQYEQGQRVKRPARSVLDADGVETRSGDTVYLLKDGGKCRVTGFETIDGEVFARLHCDDRPEIEGARGSAITHRRRVLDSDGVEIKVGDTVWDINDPHGYEMTVDRIELDALGHVRTLCEKPSPSSLSIHPNRLTHTPPDSWERLEEDAEKLACAYLGRSEGTCFGCPLENCKDFAACSKEQAKDIVRRAKVLAGVGVGE